MEMSRAIRARECDFLGIRRPRWLDIIQRVVGKLGHAAAIGMRCNNMRVSRAVLLRECQLTAIQRPCRAACSIGSRKRIFSHARRIDGNESRTGSANSLAD